MIDADMYYEHSEYACKPTLRRLDEDDDTAREIGKLTEKELMLCSRVVTGFSLQRKNWSRYQASILLRLELT
jgi:hypothetical protein